MATAQGCVGAEPAPAGSSIVVARGAKTIFTRGAAWPSASCAVFGRACVDETVSRAVS